MTERERFESWLRSIGIEPTYTLDGDYSGDAVRSRWEAWQAALKPPSTNTTISLESWRRTLKEVRAQLAKEQP